MIAKPKIAKTLLLAIDIGSAGNNQQGRGGDDRLEHAILLREARNYACAAFTAKPPGKRKAGGSPLAPHTIVGAVEPECEQEEATSSPQILVSKGGATRSERAIITPAPNRTLILVKVPC